MDRLATPEHVQFLSDRALHAAIIAARAQERHESQDVALVRTLEYELRRRRCAVPVTDRYTCVLFTAS